MQTNAAERRWFLMAAPRHPVPQTAIAGLDDPNEIENEADREADDQWLITERFFVACRSVVREVGGWDACAQALDAIWARRGRGVTASVLRAAMTGTERNYFRWEWCIWFARQSAEVADLLFEAGGRAKPKKRAEDELRDLKVAVREELSHKRADQLIRKAETI
jgi:hypothetical protein